MYKIVEENTPQALKDCIELGRKHNDEVLDRKYEPDETVLNVVLNAGLMYIVTVRLDGILVGYWLNMVHKDFISGEVMGREAAFYLSPEARGSSAFIKMVRLVEKLAKDKGAIEQLIMFEEGHDTGLAQRLGYDLAERVYKKKLGDS